MKQHAEEESRRVQEANEKQERDEKDEEESRMGNIGRQFSNDSGIGSNETLPRQGRRVGIQVRRRKGEDESECVRIRQRSTPTQRCLVGEAVWQRGHGAPASVATGEAGGHLLCSQGNRRGTRPFAYLILHFFQIWIR